MTLSKSDRRQLTSMLDKHLRLEVENARFGDEFVVIDVTVEQRSKHTARSRLERAVRNKHYLVQIFADNGYTRLSICRTSLQCDGVRWADGITWDELMAVKTAVGYGSAWCVEAYPPDDCVVNVANIRHLFVVPEPEWAWKREA
jgi:hypothetical protein